MSACDPEKTFSTLSGVKRTSLQSAPMSANDPKRKSPLLEHDGDVQRQRIGDVVGFVQLPIWSEDLMRIKMELREGHSLSL